MTDDVPLSPEHLRLQAILENAVDAIITIDESGAMQSVNPATNRLFQYSNDELLGKNVKLLMPPPYQEEHDIYLDNYRSSNIRKIIGIGREVVGKRKDGSTFPMHLAVSEITFGGQRLYTGIVRDISDIKEAETKLAKLNDELEQRVRERSEQLRAAQAELVAKEKLATLGQVSGGIAHEIRNPLNAVKTSAYYLMKAENATDEKKKEHLDRIDRQVTIIDNVITALSDVAKLPAPTVSPISVSQVLEEVICEVSMPAKISVVPQIPEDIPMVLADVNQLPIVFRNLLCNARDAMPDGGIVQVIVEQQDACVAITIRDTGVGIAEGKLSRIFEPLYSTKARGMGLGLAICKSIIEKNGGSLRFESKLGKGSAFTVELKAHDESNAR